MGSRKILVVDDERDILEMLKEVLQTHKYAVELAQNGPEGLRRLRDWAPDLLILDICMPGMDGYQVLRRVRAQSDIPVVVLTGWAELRDVLDRRQAEFPDAYLRKPVSIKDLLRSIRYLLGEEVRQE